MTLDASPILERALYQGSAPSLGKAVALRRAGFHVLVLCAREVQPVGFEQVGLKVVRVPLDDVLDPAPADLRKAASAAKDVARYVKAGFRVLVTCHLGLNRSGLVNALAVRELTGKSGSACAAHVRAKRRGALSNSTFRDLLARLPKKEVL